MIKKLASRNQRSKGVKVKHVLQILLLICICLWLLYQIKCLYDRSREMSKKGSKTPVKEEDDSGGDLKLGRKGLREKQGEEADEESKDEDEGNQGETEDAEVDEDEIQRDIARMEEQERQEGKKDEGNDEGADNREDDEGREEEEGNNDKMDEVDVERGGDDAEINEVEVEGGEAEIDHEKDFLDEDKGTREERVEEDNSGDKEEQAGDDDLPEDRDVDEVNENMHEAHEVHYQANDASDAVADDTHEDNENADEEDSNDSGVGNRLTESKEVSLNEKDSEAITGDKAEANSNVSEGDKQASNVSVFGVTEMTGSGTNVIVSVIDQPLSRRLAAPGDDSGDVSLKQTTVSTGEETPNVSTMTNGGSYQADSTPDTSTQESMKPLDPSNNQTPQVSEDVPNLDKNQEVVDSSKMLSTGEKIENLIRTQLPNEQDSGKSRTQ